MMDRSFFDLPFFSHEHKLLFESIYQWASEMPAIDHRCTDAASRNLVNALGAAGILRYCVPEEFGGALPELDSRTLCIVRETLAYHD